MVREKEMERRRDRRTMFKEDREEWTARRTSANDNDVIIAGRHCSSSQKERERERKRDEGKGEWRIALSSLSLDLIKPSVRPVFFAATTTHLPLAPPPVVPTRAAEEEEKRLGVIRFIYNYSSSVSKPSYLAGPPALVRSPKLSSYGLS